eukprot:CAMPEP_0114365916 /NCGR_PEP_ID=MMETSP0101-20121206/28825_1 /TAXON_ID=38822 ORGANISM="Pteridomonas danica, Strain PT" /NCGR_SAMPLE_ID=MMETSP0101 /ASSEMBLY_ACC=CAM_ASM_000211 /LENGTH=70 /DNA_ID=CAMNT_0001514597 /DNA_START=72 /DNA_END=284 /DNA_ORIENTATION=+
MPNAAKYTNGEWVVKENMKDKLFVRVRGGMERQEQEENKAQARKGEGRQRTYGSSVPTIIVESMTGDCYA